MGTENDETETHTATSTDAVIDPALDATVEAHGRERPRNSSSDLPDGSSIGRYRVGTVLGSGGMGVVYRARDPDLDRELAIKIVRPGSSTPRAQERLLAEAKAMAKLRHPAVVPVFDVGTTSDGVFIVMPLVSGGTMHEWMRKKRPWREVLDRFIVAGRGLGAAHAAGLVHRDFKPRNVLISDAGEVLVADFGIAARTDDSIDPERGPSTPGAAQTSSIAGTPAYMAPEQAEGGVIDARADQYSYCICLWEALCGQRPTEADTNTRAAVSMPRIQARAGNRGVPAWLLAAVARGFAASPDQRWPSMEALLGHIDGRLRRPKRLALVAGALALASAAAGAVLIVPKGARDPCPDPARELAAAWSPANRGEITAAFAATGLPYAGDTAGRVVSALDSYAASWRTKHIAACRAARVERIQSEVLFERRYHCLDRGLAALAGRTKAFRDANRTIVENAALNVERLPRLEDCDDAEALLAYATPVTPLLRPRIAGLDRQLDDLEAMESHGLIEERLEPSASIVATTRTLGYPPLHARALRLRGSALHDNGQPTESVLRELVQSAAESRDDAAVASAWTSLIDDLTAREDKLAEARSLEPVAAAALVRAGSPPHLHFRLESVLARRAMASDAHDAALMHAQKAIEVAPTATLRSEAYANQASWLATLGRHKDALPHAEAALREIEESRGPYHPDTATRLRLLADVLSGTGDASRREVMLMRATNIQSSPR